MIQEGIDLSYKKMFNLPMAGLHEQSGKYEPGTTIPPQDFTLQNLKLILGIKYFY